MTEFLPRAFFKGSFVEFSSATISIATHGLQYGTGAFGGIRGEVDPDTHKVSIFRLDDHIKRLCDSASLLRYPLDPQWVRQTIIQFVHENKPQSSFYIRPFIYTSELAIAPRLHDIQKDFNIYGLYLGDYLNPDGITCCISSWTRVEDSMLPVRGKISGAYIMSALAKTEAHERGFDEAIFLNSRGKVAEASAMNIFLIRDGKLITPRITDGILEGITRKSVIEIAHELKIEVQEREVDRSELFIADEIFLTGTAAKITPVKQIEHVSLPPTTIALTLRDAYQQKVLLESVKVAL